jgi:hypothetical protein
MLPNLVDIPADVAIFATIVSVVAVNGSVDEELLQPEDGLPALSASMLVVFGDVQTTGETTWGVAVRCQSLRVGEVSSTLRALRVLLIQVLIPLPSAFEGAATPYTLVLTVHYPWAGGVDDRPEMDVAMATSRGAEDRDAAPVGQRSWRRQSRVGDDYHVRGSFAVPCGRLQIWNLLTTLDLYESSLIDSTIASDLLDLSRSLCRDVIVV